MTWIFGLLLAALPELWLLAACAAAGLWIWATVFVPPPAAELVRWAALALVAVAAFLKGGALGGEATDARWRLAAAAEKVRIEKLAAEAVDASRARADIADAARREAVSRLEAIVAETAADEAARLAAPPLPTPAGARAPACPPAPACGLDLSRDADFRAIGRRR